MRYVATDLMNAFFFILVQKKTRVWEEVMYMLSHSWYLWLHGLQAPLSQGIFQARILGWVAISYSRRSSWPRDRTHISWVSCFARWIFTAVASGKPGRRWCYDPPVCGSVGLPSCLALPCPPGGLAWLHGCQNGKQFPIIWNRQSSTLKELIQAYVDFTAFCHNIVWRYLDQHHFLSSIILIPIQSEAIVFWNVISRNNSLKVHKRN